MLLGIEVGGTKLQLGVASHGGAPIEEMARLPIDPSRGAEGILRQIASAGGQLVEKWDVTSLGVGFGGPVDRRRGIVTKSHQVAGWEGFDLGAWCLTHLGRPATIGNDCDVAALAEALYGAGRGAERVFFVTVGTGVGGGFVTEGQLQGVGRPAIAEIGHLRPGIECRSEDETVESRASGWGIETEAARCGRWGERPTARAVAQAAAEGNRMALEIMHRATETLGWAVAQVITILAPQLVVIGGGVSQAGEKLFFEPLRLQAARYVFPPLSGSYRIVPAALGEDVVVHGAIALAEQARQSRDGDGS
jgi:glucokinase